MCVQVSQAIAIFCLTIAMDHVSKQWHVINVYGTVQTRLVKSILLQAVSSIPS